MRIAVWRVCSRTMSLTVGFSGSFGDIAEGRMCWTRLRMKPCGISPESSALLAAVTAPQESWPRTITTGVSNSSTAYSSEPRAAFSSTWPAVRTTNASPKPRSKIISAARRESPQPKIEAKGNWPAARSVRRIVSWLGCSLLPSIKRRLPSRRRFHASAGVG